MEAHGGSIKAFKNMSYDSPRYSYAVLSESDGYLNSFETRILGELLSEIGGGTFRNNDGIDNYSGLRVYKKISDKVLKDEPVLEFYCSSEKKINNLRMKTDSLFRISETQPSKPSLIY